MKRTILVDTNIIIRLLLEDDIRLTNQAKLIFFKAQEGLCFIYLDEVVVAEVVWTLSSFYKLKKIDIINQLEKLIFQDWIINPRKKFILKSLFLYKIKNLSYIDCWIFIVNQSLRTSLETFDNDLKKLK